MNIIYILTIVLIIVLHMLLYKKEEAQSFFSWLIITIGLLLSYNICISVILSFIKLKSTLITLSIINIITSCSLGLKIYKDKKVQKYYINKMDIITIISIFAIVLLVAIKQYGIPMNVKNLITDASTHYWVADEFYNYSMLLIEDNSDVMGYFNERALMPGAYINTGILFKVFSGIVEETYFCKLFILFETCMWCLSGLLMYALLANNKKEEKQKILPLIFSLIYMLGYPLNTLLSGFSYLQVGLNIIICIIFIMQQELKQNYKDILIFLLNFGLMFSYYYFAPVVFLAIFVQKIVEIKKRNEKVFSTNNILSIVISLILPGLFGIMYFFIFQRIKFGIQQSKQLIEAINTPGGIYQNFITNIAIFLVLSAFYIVDSFKNRKENFLNKILVITIIFLIILFIGMKLEKVSEYYYYKVYYMAWIPLIVVGFNATELFEQKNKILTYIGVGAYCVGIIIAIIFNKNLLLFDIYQKNFEEVKANYNLVNYKELEILEYYNKNINIYNNFDDNTYIYLSNSTARARWLYAITKNPYIYIDAVWGEWPTDIQQFLESEKHYCIIFKRDNCEEIFKDIDKKDGLKILFQNEEGAILEKNN